MVLSIKCMIKFLGCVIFGLVYCQFTEALQCYVCDSCVDGTKLQEIQMCGELPFESTTQSTSSPSSAPTQSTDTPTSTIKPSPLETSTSTKRSSSSRATTRRPNTTTRKSTTKQDTDSEENYSDYEDSDENDRRMLRIATNNATIGKEHRTPNKELMNVPKQFDPVCFMVKFRVNNTQITNLGCTSMVKDNVFLTCQSLKRTDATMEDCQLCGENGCNKLFFDENSNYNDWDYPWFNGSNKIHVKIANFLFMFLMMKFIH